MHRSIFVAFVALFGISVLPSLGEGRGDALWDYDINDTLPTCNAANHTRIVGVTDGASASDCTTGNGAFAVQCQCIDDGTPAWEPLGGGADHSGTDDEIFYRSTNDPVSNANFAFRDLATDRLELIGVIRAGDQQLSTQTTPGLTLKSAQDVALLVEEGGAGSEYQTLEITSAGNAIWKTDGAGTAWEVVDSNARMRIEENLCAACSDAPSAGQLLEIGAGLSRSSSGFVKGLVIANNLSMIPGAGNLLVSAIDVENGWDIGTNNGVIPAAHGLHVGAATVSSVNSVTNLYGGFFQAQTEGDNNWSIFAEGDVEINAGVGGVASMFVTGDTASYSPITVTNLDQGSSSLLNQFFRCTDDAGTSVGCARLRAGKELLWDDADANTKDGFFSIAVRLNNVMAEHLLIDADGDAHFKNGDHEIADGSIILGTNSEAIIQDDSGGTQRQLLRLSAGDDLIFGSANDLDNYHFDLQAGFNFRVRDASDVVVFQIAEAGDGLVEGDWSVNAGDNAAGNVGAFTSVRSNSATVNSSAGTTLVASNLIPAGAKLVGLTARITTAFGTTNGLTSIDIGDGSDVDLWGATIAITVNTTVDLTDATADPEGGWSASARSVTLTGNGDGGDEFDGTGTIELLAHYVDLTAPTG